MGSKTSEDQNDTEASESKSIEIQNKEKVEEDVLKFLDSVDDYLIFIDSLSSILRQGWLELASARHSMGASRINASLFDLKYHSAPTTFHLDRRNVSSDVEQPHFVLHKWESSDSPNKDSCEAKFEEDKLAQSISKGLRVRTKSTSESSEMQEKMKENSGSPLSVDGQAQKERLKSLSMFGALVSPKLRAAQSSFETALETIAEIANVRASLLCAHEQVQREMENNIP